MPTKTTGEATVVAAQQAQRGLVAVMVRDMAAVWHMLHVDNLDQTLPHWKLAVAGVVHRYGLMSATLSSRFYERARLDAGVRSPFNVPLAEPPSIEHVDAALSWATRELWSGDVEHGLGPEVVHAAETNAEGAAAKLALDTGRRTIVDALGRDREAHGWARILGDDHPCAFCAMLASRGAVYESRETAGTEANKRFAGEGLFKFHDHCHCTVEPLFSRTFTPTERVREMQKLWEESTKGVRGSREKRIAFRQAIEGREPAGKVAMAKKAAEQRVTVGKTGRTEHEISSELAALRANLPRTSGSGRAYHETRIAQLERLLGQ